MEILRPELGLDNQQQQSLFESIEHDIAHQGFSVQLNGLDDSLAQQLWFHLQQMPGEKFDDAGIGRETDHMQNRFVRRDEICWINGEYPATKAWLDWTSQLQQHLNRSLFMGLFSFESHFAHYRPGDFYKRHLDAFKGQANRVLSLVVYLNPGWTTEDGGEIVIYRDEQDQEGIKVLPHFGTVVAFLSEDFPHEVLPAHRDRYSIAGWFRVNANPSKQVLSNILI
jgi:SM-20-related protein